MESKDWIQNPADPAGMMVSTTCQILDEQGVFIGVIQSISGEVTAHEFGDWLHTTKIPGKEKELVATKVAFFLKLSGNSIIGRNFLIKDTIRVNTTLDNKKVSTTYRVVLNELNNGVDFKDISGSSIRLYPELIFEVISVEDHQVEDYNEKTV